MAARNKYNCGEIISAAGSVPKAYLLPNKYQAAIVSASLVNTAWRMGIEDLIVIKRGLKLFVWRGIETTVQLNPEAVKKHCQSAQSISNESLRAAL